MKRNRFTMLLVSGLVGACAQEGVGESDFRRAVPSSDDLAMRVPGYSAAAVVVANGTTTDTGEPSADGLGERAELYQFTRDISQGVNGTTAAIVVMLDWITDHEPTSVDENTAVWGPGTPTLSPLTYMLVVEADVSNGNVGQHRYVLLAKPKLADDDAYEPLLAGASQVTSSGIAGQLALDLTAANALDPREHPDTGSVYVDYDTTESPRVVRAAFGDASFDDSADFDGLYEYTEADDHSGTFKFGMRSQDIDPSTEQLEWLVIGSRWNADGAGRGDGFGANPDSSDLVGHLVECWDTGFNRTYILSNFGIGEAGDPSACAYEDPFEL